MYTASEAYGTSIAKIPLSVKPRSVEHHPPPGCQLPPLSRDLEPAIRQGKPKW